IISTNRNSEGFELTVGTSIDISGKSKGEVFVGYLKQEYESSDLENIQSPTFGANILWNVTQLTSLIVGVTRSVEETVISGSSGYLGTGYEVIIEHELLRSFIARAGFSFNTNDYQGGTNVVRKDDIGLVKIETKYLINRNLSLRLGYQYERRDSNLVNQD